MAFTPQVALDYLGSAQKRSRLAHAYLITGAAGSGKRALAAELAHRVNGAPAEEIFAGSAPDVHLASPESKSRRISIEQLRDLEHALQMRASDGRRKVVIISDADRMGTQAANAFLKTLEEPPNNSLLLLLSAIPEVLPETILSRCIEIPLASSADVPLTSEQEELVELLARLTNGSGGGSTKRISSRRACSASSDKSARRSRKRARRRSSGRKRTTKRRPTAAIGWTRGRIITRP